MAGTNPLVDDPRGYGPAYEEPDPFGPIGGSALVFGPGSPIVATGFFEEAMIAAASAIADAKSVDQLVAKAKDNPAIAVGVGLGLALVLKGRR